MNANISTIWMVILCLGFTACAPSTRLTSKTDGPGAQIEVYNGPKACITVSNITDKTNGEWWDPSIGNEISEILATALFNTNRYIVLEPQTVGDLLQEQDFEASGRIRQNTASPTGQRKGAELLITGAVTAFDPAIYSRCRNSNQSARIAIDLRIIDIKTSHTIAATIVTGSSKDIKDVEGIIGTTFGSSLEEWANTPKGKALVACLNKAVEFVISQIPSKYYHYEQGLLNPSQQNIKGDLPQYLTVTIDRANVRSGPGTQNAVVGTVTKGQKLSVAGKQGNWYQVFLPSGKIAWIYKTLVK